MAEINNLEDIKVNFEKITNLINSMRAQGVLSFSGMDKVLTSINSKLDNINFEENADLIKLLIGEVKTNIEERHGFVVSKFAEIESSVNTLLKDNEDSLKAPEIKRLFDVIATNLAVFSKEVISQKDALSEITLRLESLRTDDTNKNEIIKNISTLKFDIARINNGFESIILNINNNFGELASSFQKLSENNLNDKYGNSIDDIHATSNTILSAIQMLDKKNTELNEGLDRLITIGDFNEAKEIILDLVTKHDDMKSVIASVADRDSVNNLSGIVSSSISAINELRAIIIDNSDERSRNIISKLDVLEATVKNSSEQFDFKQFKAELLGVVNDIGKETNVVCNDLLETNNDLKRILNAVNLADFNSNLEKINLSISENQANYRDALEQATEKVTNENRDYINAVINNFNFQMNELNDKVAVLTSEINPSANEYVNQIADDIVVLSNTANEISGKIDSVNAQTIDSFNNSLAQVKQKIEELSLMLDGSSRKSTEDIIEKLNGVFSVTSDLKTEFLLVAENNAQKITSNIQNLSEVLGNLSGSVQNIPFELGESFEQKLSGIDAQLKELADIINNNSENRSEQIIENISKVYNQFGTLSEDIKQVYSTDSELIKNNIEQLYSKINEFNSEIPTLLFQTSGKISEDISVLQSKVESTHNYLDTISSKLEDNGNDSQALEKFEAINSDIRLVIESLSGTVSDNHSMLYNKVEEINNDLKKLSGALFENIGSNRADLNNKLGTIVETVETLQTTLLNNIQNSDTELVQSRLEVLAKEIKDTINDANSNVNDNNELWLRKLDSITNDAFEVQNTILTSIQGVNLDINDKLHDASFDIQEKISGVSNNIQEQTNAIGEKLDSVSEHIASTSNKTNDKLDFIESSSAEILEKLGGISQDLISKNEQFDSRLLENSENVNIKLQSISEAITNAETNTVNIIEEKSSGISEKLETVSKDVQNVTDKLANYFINNDSDLSSRIQNISEQVTLSTNTNSERINSLENKSNNISEKLDNISSEIKDVTGEIVTHFLSDKDRTIEQSDNINKNIDYTRGQILERIESNSENMSNDLNSLKTGIESINDRIEGVKKVSDNTDVLITKLDNITTDVKGITSELINQISQDEDEKNAKYQILNDTINYSKQELSEQIVEGNKTTSNEISQLFENLENSKTEINQNIAANASAINNLTNNAEYAKSEIIENNNIGIQNLKEALTSTVHTSESGINEKLENINENLNESKAEIINQIQSEFAVNESLESVRYEVKALEERLDETSNAIITASELKSQDIHTNINTTRDAIVANTKEVVEIVNKIVLALDKKEDFVSDKNDELFSRIKDSIAEFQGNVDFSNRVLIDSVKNNNDEVKTIIETLSERLENSTKMKIDQVEEIIDNLKALLEENKQVDSDNINYSYSSILTELSKILEASSTKNIQLINENIAELKSLIDDIVLSNNDNNSTMEEHSVQLQNILDAIGNVFHTITESDNSILEKFESEYSELKSLVNNLSDSANNNKQVLSDLIYTRVGGIETLLSKIEAKLEANKNETYDHIIESIDNIKAIAEDTDLRINESICKMRDIQDKSIEILNETQASIDNKLFELKDSSSKFYGDIEQSIDSLRAVLISRADWGEKFNDMEGALINLSRDLNILTNQSPNHNDIETIQTEINILRDEFKTLTAESSETKNEIFVSEISRHFDNLCETLNSAIDAQKESVIADNKHNTDIIIENIDSIKPEIEKINNILRENGIQNASSISTVKNLVDNVSDLFSETETKINDSIQEKTDSIASQIDTLLNSIKLLDENLDEDTTRQLSIIQDELASITSALFTNTDKMTLASKLHFDEVYEKFEYVSDLINKTQAEQAQISSNNIEKITASFNNLNKLFEECDDVKNLLANLSEILNKSYESITDKIEETSSQSLVEQCINKVELVENKLDSLDFATRNSEEAGKIIISSIEQLEQKLASIEDGVETLNQNTLAEDIKEVKELVSTQNNQIKTLIQETSSQEQVELCINKVDILDNKLDKLDFANKTSEDADKLIISNIELIEQKLEAIEGNVESLTDNSLLSGELRGIKELINTQQEQIKTLSTIEDIKNLPGIEDIESSIKTGTAELLESFNKTFEENSTKEIIAKQLSELKSDILAQTVTILDQISFEIEQGEIMDYIQENTNIVKASITNVKDEILSKTDLHKEELLNTLVSKNDIASEFDYVNKKLDDLSDTYEMQKGFDGVHAKLDDILEETIEKGFEDVHSKLDYVANNDELQREFNEVKKHLLTIQSGDSKADYTYSLQDVESDIAKLRIAMKELQDITPDEELENLTKKVDDIVMVVDSIKHQISQAEIDEIGANVEKMNEDIVSISSRTNKLILTSENSANMLKENIDSFKLVIDDMDERTRALAENNDLSDVHESISTIQHTLRENANHTQVVNQSLIAIAEWVDCAGNTLTSISEKVNKLNDIEDVKAMIRSIEMPRQFDYSVFDSIDEKFNAQQDKIDALEEKINRLTELVEANDNSQINKKITSVDRQLAKLNKSIERLTSYVDEE